MYSLYRVSVYINTHSMRFYELCTCVHYTRFLLVAFLPEKAKRQGISCSFSSNVTFCQGVSMYTRGCTNPLGALYITGPRPYFPSLARAWDLSRARKT